MKNQACATVTKGCEAVTQLDGAAAAMCAGGRRYEEKKKKTKTTWCCTDSKKLEQLPVFPAHD